MCLIAFSCLADPRYPLVMIANRDEFVARPARPLGFWPEAPALCAGRDVRAGGTWLGVHRSGRLAAVTNVREGVPPSAPRSRGALPLAFLEDRDDGAAFAARLRDTAPEYGGFNLLLWDGVRMLDVGNRPAWRQRTVAPGLHGLSNADLDAPWPKVRRAQAWLADWLASGDEDPTPLLDAMMSRERADDRLLPDTGVGLDVERSLSPAFIQRPGYGTRCTTFVAIRADGRVDVVERRYDADGRIDGVSRERFAITA